MKVYLADAAKLTELDLQRLFDALPPGRRAYAERFKQPTDRAAAAVGFLLVVKALRDADPAFRTVVIDLDDGSERDLPAGGSLDLGVTDHDFLLLMERETGTPQ